MWSKAGSSRASAARGLLAGSKARNDNMILTKAATSSAHPSKVVKSFNSDLIGVNLTPSAVARLSKSGDEEDE